MAGKSLEQVTREIQSRMAEERNRRISQEKTILEQSEKSRREYLERMRLLEAIAPSSAAAAAGAGAGGSGNRVKIYPATFKQGHIVHWVEDPTDLQKIRIYNYTDGVLSAEFNTGLTGIDWFVAESWLHVQTGGFSIAYSNANDGKYKIFFFNAEGTHLATKDLDTNEDFQYTENAMCYLGLLNGTSTAYHFDGNNVFTHTFDDAINTVEVDDGSEDDCTEDGSMIVDINNTTYYIMRPDGKLKNISAHMSGVNNNYKLDYLTDYIAARKSDYSAINIISQEGELVNSLDLSGYSIVDELTSSLYGDKSVFYMLDTDAGATRLLVTYNGPSNQFATFTYSIGTVNEFYGYDEWTWFIPRSSNGRTFITSTYNYVTGDGLGYVATDVKINWLPDQASDFITLDLTSQGTMSIVDGWGWYAQERTFSLGSNPMMMLAKPDAEIEVLELSYIGGLTFSTGILSASCSNIWGGPMDQYNWAVFDVGSDRIFQIYGEGTILEQFTISSNWSVGNLYYGTNRYGTLAVLDYNVPTNNTFYTAQEGIVPGPTGYGRLYNSVDYGRRIPHSFPEQVITQFVPGEEGNYYVHGFHVLSLSGVSAFVELTPGTFSTLTVQYDNHVRVGEDIIAFRLTDAITTEITISVYNKSTLELIYEENIGLTASSQIWLDRVVIDRSSGNDLDITFVGAEGPYSLFTNQTGYGIVANDVVSID